jgi:hypothetical protein
MNMRRSPAFLLGALAAGAAVFTAAFFVAQQICVRRMANPADELAWLRYEFRLNDAELARIRELHVGYLPRCHEMCEKIAAKKREVDQTLAGATGVTSEAEQRLVELGALRAQCQAHMLRHFVEVSRVMPPAQGKRYLAEMQRLTLGFHEQIEQSMSGSAGHSHGH